MSYALAPRTTSRRGDSDAPASSGPPPEHIPEQPDLAPAALTVTPACDGVYCYSVSGSSAWTTTDLLRVLQAIVRSAPDRPARSGGSTERSANAGDGASGWPDGDSFDAAR